MALPGVNSVIVPPPSVVVVVEVVVSETWAHANGAAAATAMLSSSFFIFWLSFFGLRAGAPCPVETEIAGCSNYHKSIATLPIDGCVTSKTKSYISLNKSGTVPSGATFRFPSRLGGGILSPMEPTMGDGAEELLQTYTEDGGINYLAAAAMLPSRSVIDGACAELMSLMFPGFRGEPLADSRDLPEVTRSRLRKLHPSLKPHYGQKIGSHFFMHDGTGVVIGETCEIGTRVKLYHGVTLGARSFQKDEGGKIKKGGKRHPTVEDDVTIYPNSTVLGGETVIGARSTIGGNVFLVQSVPADSLVSYEETQLHIVQKRPRLRGQGDGGFGG